MRGGSLMRFARNVYSQNGEDGVIAEVMRRLGIYKGIFVEFGAGDGRTYSNTLRLAQYGWSGVWIEADADSADKATMEAACFDGRVQVMREMIDHRSDSDQRIDALLRRLNLPREVDFMSIDIDSFDLEVWESIRDYRAKVVLIEINSSIVPGVGQRHGVDGAQGASFSTTVHVGKLRGYTLVCHTGNLLFVETSLASGLMLPQAEREDPSSLFNPTWVDWAQASK